MDVSAVWRGCVAEVDLAGSGGNATGGHGSRQRDQHALLYRRDRSSAGCNDKRGNAGALAKEGGC